MSSKWAYLAAAVCMSAIALAIYAPLASSEPYHYDEADYMWAGRQGFADNYIDSHGLSFVEFVTKGLELSKNPAERQSFSEYIRTVGDIGLYRHYHGPVYAYWLALIRSVGATGENVFRGSGLVLLILSAFLILLGFWSVFPSLPRIAGLAAFTLFIFDRTTLAAAMTITQHGVFTLLCIAALFSASRFMRDYDVRWYYITMAILGVAFAAVETTVLLLPGLVIALLIDRRRVWEKWPSFGRLAVLLLEGCGVLVLTILVLWPFGIVRLGIAKGFLTLAYMAVVRRNFSPIGPIQFFGLMYRTSPWEITLLMAGGIAVFPLWKRFAERREMLPWLGFIGAFFVILLKITLPYVYYFAPLAAALVVACGIVFGALWMRGGVWRPIAIALTIGSIVGSTAQNVERLKPTPDVRTFEADTLAWLKSQPGTTGTFYVPFQLVPTLHYYHPELKTVGYDFDYPLARLIDGVKARDAAPMMLCEEPFCSRIESSAPGTIARKDLLNGSGPNRQPFYVAYIGRAGGL